jgi:hypothetical protein
LAVDRARPRLAIDAKIAKPPVTRSLFDHGGRKTTRRRDRSNGRTVATGRARDPGGTTAASRSIGGGRADACAPCAFSPEVNLAPSLGWGRRLYVHAQTGKRALSLDLRECPLTTATPSGPGTANGVAGKRG